MDHLVNEIEVPTKLRHLSLFCRSVFHAKFFAVDNLARLVMKARRSTKYYTAYT